MHLFRSIPGVLAGASAALGQCQYGVGGINLPIPDMGSVSYPLWGLASGVEVTSVRLCLALTHGRQGDVVIQLTHAGVTTTLLNRPGTEDGQSTEGYTATDFGSMPGGSFSFADDAAAPYAVPPVGNTPRPGIHGVAGLFKPTIQPLSAFNGLPAAGDWIVTISDQSPGFTGTLLGVSLGINLIPAPQCWANCDGSPFAPALTAGDFQCFLNEFAAGHTYANCDGSTGTPMLTANDFQCFLNAYAMGCPQ